jgi:hypothetical protein
MGPSTLKCKCISGKYFNKDTSKCEQLLEIGENCSQADSCKTGYCFGSPLKCQCLTLHYFDQNSGLCLDNISISASPLTTISIISTTLSTKITAIPSSTTSSSTKTTTTTSKICSIIL